MKFSVVIPTCDRPEALRECLRRVMEQMTTSHEIIVSDDGRTEGPVPGSVRRVQGPRRGPAANRNRGAKEATGEWIVFLDDDCLPEEGWLAAYEAAAREGVDVLEGRTVCPMEDRFAFYEYVENLKGGAFWSCNLAVRRMRFEELGGFDEDFTEACAEDMEFAWRMRERGLKSVFVSAAGVTHPARTMGMQELLKRTAAHRWVLLYRLKTGQEEVGWSGPRALGALVWREFMDNLRMTYHLRFEEKRWKAWAMGVIWRWVSLGWFLPYYGYWEIKWKRMKVGGGGREV